MSVLKITRVELLRMRDLNSKAEEEEELMPKGPTVRLLEERQEQQKNAAQKL